MAQDGLLEWANSVRYTMVADPGRKFFDDQIKTHGFLFLDNYLDGILAGTRQKDPIIELVKTPGRKKVASKKVKSTVSKLNSVISVSLEDDDDGAKENIAPVNEFHRALLHAKEQSDGSATYHNRSVETPAVLVAYQETRPANFTHDISEVHEEQAPVVAIAASTPSISSDSVGILDSALLVPSRMEQSGLSMIAEGDESVERSRVSIQVLCQTDTYTYLPPSNAAGTSDMDTALDSLEQDETRKPTVESEAHEAANVTGSSSMDTFHSIPLGSPLQPQQFGTSPPQPSSVQDEKPCSPSPNSPKIHPSNPPESMHRRDYDNFTAPLPEIPPWHPPSQADFVTAPLPSILSMASDTTSDIQVPLRDADRSPPRGLVHKPSIPTLPVLPAPQPMRKSMRAPREPAPGTTLGSATPGAPLGGKRTSWLKKVREVREVMEQEDAGKRMSTLGGSTIPAAALPIPGMPNGTKRKSGDMFSGGASTIASTTDGDDERLRKAARLFENDLASQSKAKALTQRPPSPQLPVALPLPHPQPRRDVPATNSLDQGVRDDQDGMLDRFKRTVEGLGARVGKSMGKSLGGAAAATALAEARAAAEARIAERERNKAEEYTVAIGLAQEAPVVQMAVENASDKTYPTPAAITGPAAAVREVERRLSVSDLVSSYESKKGKGVEAVFHPSQPAKNAQQAASAGNDSTSTTPPNSPPQPTSFVLPSGPVFNKPPRVFVPPEPALAPAKESRFNLPGTTFSMPAAMSLGLAPRLPSPSSQQSRKPSTLSSQSTVESIASDVIFDTQGDALAWEPRTQDTDYSQPETQPTQEVIDEDDSWPVSEKFATGAHWTFGAVKEDSLTWSTLPTESQRADSGPVPKSSPERRAAEASRPIPGAFDMEMDSDDALADDDMAFVESDLEDMVLAPGQSTVSLVEPKVTRSQSQISMASSTSSQSHAGFLGQASKLMNSVLGTGKKGKQEVKSLQLAAAAAKKQQEEKDKKAARLKEMENRRQLALQRKAEEEKSRAVEEERKLKEEGERRKREREEHTDKRPLKVPAKKEDNNTKKRKLVVEIEKKPELKKPASKIAKPSLNASGSTKIGGTLKSAMKQPVALSSSNTFNSSQQVAVASTSTAKVAEPAKLTKQPSATKGKGKAPAKAQIQEDDITQPSQVLQTQMAARAKAQLDAAKQLAAVESESIELPDINSEYSDSEDEDRPRTFDPPDWAQSPELRQALQLQATVNPDDIFGEIRPLRMEEIFKTRTSRFRQRTSSANWTGTDRLTAEEQRDYARRMGFR